MHLLRFFESAARRRIAFFVSSAVLIAVMLACTVEAPGERASTGTCPPGETCSEATPHGLTFVGTGFFDDEFLRLGPMIVGGRFDVGIRNPSGDPLPAFGFEIADGSILTASRGTGVFGPKDDAGAPTHPVDAYLTLEAHAPGTTMLRVVDPATGDLLDRIEMKVFEISDAIVVNLDGSRRDHVIAGQEELLGVRLLASDGTTELRAVDQDLQFTADTNVQPENMYWDCFRMQIPEGIGEINFTIRTGGRTFTKTMRVEASAATTAPSP